MNQIIDRIEATINLPKGGEYLSTQITCNTANIAGASLNWIDDYGDIASYYPYTYKAHMTFTPAAGYIVTDATEIIVNESTLSDNKTVNADGTITITKDYPSTKDKIIKVIPPTVPSDNTFAEYYTADSIIFSNNEVFNDELGEYAGFLSEGAPLGFEHSLRVIWYIDGTYDETPGAENTFIWKNFDDLSNYEVDSSCKTSGTVKIKNKAATPVTITGTDSSISFNGLGIDVSQYFTIDENAGTPTYSIISHTEDGSVTGKGNLDGSTLTVTKTGTIKVKLTTSANGNYAAGEATITLTISNGTIQDYTAADYSGTYDGQAHSIDVNVTNPAGTKITYGEDGINYSEENPKYTDAGEYTVYYKIEKANYDTIKGSKTVNISRKDVTITAGNQSVVWNHNIDQTKYKVSGLAGGDSITDITLTPSTSALTDNGIITVSNVKIGNRKDVTHSYNILVVNGRLEITHDTTLAPTGINAIKTKQSYKEGDILNVDDIIVTANYADGYSENVTEFTTNASDIDMNIAGNKTLTVSYTKNGGTKTCDIIINVVHVHKFDGAIWKSDGINHWKECTIAHCDKSDGYRIDETAHTYIHTYIWSGDNKKCTATRKCEICEYTDSETVDTTATVTQSKNCTRPELTTYKAVFTNPYFAEQTMENVETAPATGHISSDWILDKPATIKESGSRHKECIVCGETLEVEEIEKLEQVAYEIINGTDSKWVENSESSIVISGNGELAKFTGVKVDGELIDSTNYIATEGSTIITLKADYLKTLSVGSHSFEIVWEDGMASTNFNVVKKTSDNDHNNGNNDNNNDDNDNNNNGNDNNNNSNTNAGDNKNNNANSNTNQAGLPGNKKNDLSDTKGNHQSTTPAKTGDSTNLTLWITLLMASIAGITGIFTRRKKKNCK